MKHWLSFTQNPKTDSKTMNLHKLCKQLYFLTETQQNNNKEIKNQEL